jgi:hypothetical protein
MRLHLLRPFDEVAPKKWAWYYIVREERQLHKGRSVFLRANEDLEIPDRPPRIEDQVDVTAILCHGQDRVLKMHIASPFHARIQPGTRR